MSKSNVDAYALNRFVIAQEESYERALSEIERGRKESHWMWYIFPQLEGLGSSPSSNFYSIKSEGEHAPILNTRCSGEDSWHAPERCWPSRENRRGPYSALPMT